MNKPDIREVIKQEYIKCATDPAHFMRKYCHIQHPTRGRIIFNLYPFQGKVLNLWKDNPYSIVLKSRQLGISTLAAGYSLWLMTFHKDKNILCLATTQETAKNMVTKVKFMYDNLPSWLKVPSDENNKLALKLNNGSQIKAKSSNSDAARSEAVSLLLIDEAAFIDNIAETWASAQQTLATGGQAIVLSTPYGTGNWFHKTWVSAETQENDFLPIKLPWWVHPERDEAWRKKQDELLGDERLAAQECDCDFASSGEGVFVPEWIEHIKENTIKDPLLKRGIDHNLWVWEEADYSKEYILCLPTGEKVLSEKGLKNIEDITYNDRLIDQNGEYTNILDIKKRIYNGDIYEIQPVGTVRTTKFTDEHPILISKHNSKEIWYKNKENKYRRKQELEFEFNFKDAKDVKIGDWIKFPNIYYDKTKKDEYFLEIYKPYLEEGRIDFQNTIKNCILEEDFWWYIGIWLAEGWINEDKKGNKTIETAHNKDENYIYNRIEYISKRLFGRKSFISNKDSNTTTIKFNNKGLSNFLLNNFNKEAKNKSIPEWVKFLPDNLKVSLIQGYLEGDGCSFLCKSKNNITLNFVSISLKLLEDIQEILFSLGVCSIINNLKKPNRKETIHGKEYICQGSYSLIIGAWDTNIFLSKVNPKYKSNPKILNINNLKQVRKLKKGCFLSDDNKWIYFRVKNIKKHKYKGLVHNFTVDNTNTFLCRNITTHNCADVARGDGKDYSACHVIDITTNSQVAEYKGQLPPKEFGFFLVGLATEYNNALLVVENASIGWAALDSIIERGYRNLYQSPKSDHFTAESYLKIYEGNSELVPGFTMSMKTRPLCINKLREFVGDKSVTIRSKRLLEEMKVFIWKNGRAEAQQGYNDDLVMSFSIGMFLRDTSLKFQQQSLDSARAALGSFKTNTSIYKTGFNNGVPNPYSMEIGTKNEDIKWLL